MTTATHNIPHMLYRKQVCDICAISNCTLQRWLKDPTTRKRLGAKKVLGQYRFVAEAVELFARSRTY